MDQKQEVVNILLEDIIPNRFQPRLSFDEKELNALASSIKTHGVLQPLLLRKIGDKYEIIAGERRYKASAIAGLVSVPSIIMETDDDTSAELAIVENVQRRNLNPMEEAQSYKKLADKGVTQDEIARKIGVNQSTIANKIRLLSLTEEVKDALLNNKISERHARSLLTITESHLQTKLLNKIITDKLTVKQTEEEIAKMLGKNTQVENIKQEEIINLDNAPKMDLDFLLKPELQSQEQSQTNNYNEELSTINPFQDNNQTLQDNDKPLPDVVSFQDNAFLPNNILSQDNILPQEVEKEPFSNVEKSMVEFIDFDDKEELKLDNPAIQPIEDVLPINPLVEEFRQQKMNGVVPLIEEDPSSKSLLDAINSVRDLSRELNNKGFLVDTEEFDFEDMYQVVFKIQKD